MKNLFVALAPLLIIIAPVSAQDRDPLKEQAAANQAIYKGNQLYREQDYKGAANAYEQALQKVPGSVAGNYNAGNAAYNTGDYEKASKQFSSAAEASKDRTEKARAYHNLGNSKMKKEQWQEAVEAFKQSLRLNPNDKETRYNLAYALEKLKSQDKNKDKNKDKKNQDKKDQNKNQDKQDQDKNKDDKGKSDKPEENKGNDKKDDQGNKDPKDQQEQQPKAMQSKLSREQAENLLNALRGEEKKIQDKKNKKKGAPVRVEKDW